MLVSCPDAGWAGPGEVGGVLGRDNDVSRSYYQSSNPIGQHFIHKVYVMYPAAIIKARTLLVNRKIRLVTRLSQERPGNEAEEVGSW